MLVTQISKTTKNQRFAIGSPTVAWKTDPTNQEYMAVHMPVPQAGGNTWQEVSVPLWVNNQRFDCGSDGTVALGGTNFVVFQPSMSKQIPADSDWLPIYSSPDRLGGGISVPSCWRIACIETNEEHAQLARVRFGAGSWQDIKLPNSNYLATAVAVNSSGDAIVATEQLIERTWHYALFYVYGSRLPIKIGTNGPYTSLNLLEDGRIVCVDGNNELVTYFGEGRWHSIQLAEAHYGPNGKLTPKLLKGAINWVSACSMHQMYVSVEGQGIYASEAGSRFTPHVPGAAEYDELADPPAPATAMPLEEGTEVDLSALQDS